MLAESAQDRLAPAASKDAGTIAPLEVLLRLLDHENEAHRFYAARAIGAIAPTIIDQGCSQNLQDALAMHLEDPDPDVRHESIVAIRAGAKPLSSGRLADRLIASLTYDPEIDVKCEAIAVLAEWRCFDALPIVRQIAAFDLADDDLMVQASADAIDITWDEIEADIDDRLRAQKAAIRALRDLGNANDAWMLTSLALSEASEDIGPLVCTVLAQLGDAGRTGLVKLSQSARSRVRRDAVSELGNCADTNQLLALRTLYSDPDPEVRAALLSAIGDRAPDDSLLQIACRDSSSIVRSCATRYVTNNFQLIKLLLGDSEVSVRLAALKALALKDAIHGRLARRIDRMASEAHNSVIDAVPPALIAVADTEARRSLHAWIGTSRYTTGLRVSALRSLVKLEKEQDLSKQQVEWNKTQALASSMLTDDARDMRLCAIAVLVDEANDGNTVAADYLAKVLSRSINRLVVLRDDKARSASAFPMGKADPDMRKINEKADPGVASIVSEQAVSLSTLESILNSNDETSGNNNRETVDWKDSLDERERHLLGSTSHWPKAKHISLTPDISLDLDVARCITRACAGIANPNLLAALVEAFEFPDAELAEAAAQSLSQSLSGSVLSDTDLTLRVLDVCKTLLGENRGNLAIATIALLGNLPVKDANKILLNLLDHTDPWLQLAALRALSAHPDYVEVIRNKAAQFLDYGLTELRHSAIQILGQNDDTESIHMLIGRLGAHAGSDASIIGKTITMTASATAEEGLCQLLCDNARQREWRFATEILAACVIASVQ